MVTISRGIYERFNGTTETSEKKVKELIIFDGNYIQVFYEKDQKVIGWNEGSTSGSTVPLKRLRRRSRSLS